MPHRTERDGYVRIVYGDAVHWVVARDHPVDYLVARFPFVPNYHLCDLIEDDAHYLCERPLQQFTTLTQALAVLRVIEGSQ